MPRDDQNQTQPAKSNHDEQIKEDVSQALYHDPALDASEIEVLVKDGIVILNGTVITRDAKRRAEYCAEKARGVEDVQNQLKLQRPTRDDEITGGRH